MKPIIVLYDSIVWRCFAVCAFLVVAGCTKSDPRSWDIQKNHILVYDLVVNMAHDGSGFTESDDRVIEMVINAGEISIKRSSTIEGSSESFGPYVLGVDGSMSGPQILVNPPPLEAELILHIFTPGGLGDGSPPVNWSTVDPQDSVIVDDKIELQQRSEFTFQNSRAVGGSDIEEYALKSTVRLIDNGQIKHMIGMPADRTPELQNTIDNLGRDNLFLFGIVSWNRQDRVTENAKFTYVSAPHPSGTTASIAASKIRQEMIIRRR